MIDFQHGVMKKFKADSKSWQDTPSTVPRDLLQENLSWTYRVYAQGGGTVHVLNTRDMVLHCLDIASRQWAEIRQADTSYRARYAAMTYNNGILYVSGGDSLDGEEQNTMISLAMGGAGNYVSVQQQPDMLYRRSSHEMVEVGGRILVCGGVMDNVDRLAASEVFDLGTGTWSHLSDMPVAKSAFGLIPAPTAVFVLGGITWYGTSDVSPTLSDTVSVFDWQTRQWNPLPTLPMPLMHIQGVYRDESLWVLAAVTGQRDIEDNPGAAFYDRLRCVLEYNITQQRWIAHHNTPDVGTDGITAYTFPL